MLIGSAEHSLDSKNRFFLPAKYRRQFATVHKFVITGGLEGCLFIYPENSWKKIMAKLESLPSIGKEEIRTFERIFLSLATETEIDNQGRMLIPQNLAKYAGIKRIIVSVGMLERIEIWSKDRWNKYKEKMLPAYTKVAENLGI